MFQIHTDYPRSSASFCIVTYNINWSLLLGQTVVKRHRKERHCNKDMLRINRVRKSEKTALRERQKSAMYFKIRTRRYKKTAKKPLKN